MQKNTKKIAFILAWAFFVPAFIMGQVSFWQGMSQYANADEALTSEQQAAADKVAAEEAARKEEDRQAGIKDDMSDTEKKLKRETAALAKLQQQKAKIGQSVSITQLAINKTQSVIKETAQTISRKEAEVKNLNEKIEMQRIMLGGLLQQMYYNQGQPILNVVLTTENFSDVFSDTDHLLTIEDKLRSLALEISQTKEQVEQDKAELALEKEKHEEILDVKVDQKQELVADQVDVQGDIQEKEATIAELKQKLTELQSDLNVLTGKSYDAKDINDAILFVSKKTGVPKGILFAFLTQESGRGKNVGQCTYDDMKKKAIAAYQRFGKAHKWNPQNSINTLNNRQKLFNNLVDVLGYDENKKISCAIIPADFSRYSPNQGGAMGVAQFMSDTWNSYKSQVAANTGHSNPDPWNLTDGTMALAIKVRNAGGTSTSPSAIKKMVTRYYGASPDSDAVAKRYYINVLYFVKNYDKLVNN